MLYEMGADKIEIGMFLPFLDLIFRGNSDEEAFAQYLLRGYSAIGITVIDRERVKRPNVEEDFSIYPYVNEPGCIPLLLILRTRKLKDTFLQVKKYHAQIVKRNKKCNKNIGDD